MVRWPMSPARRPRAIATSTSCGMSPSINSKSTRGPCFFSRSRSFACSRASRSARELLVLRAEKLRRRFTRPLRIDVVLAALVANEREPRPSRQGVRVPDCFHRGSPAPRIASCASVHWTTRGGHDATTTRPRIDHRDRHVSIINLVARALGRRIKFTRDTFSARRFTTKPWLVIPDRRVEETMNASQFFFELRGN